MILKRGSIVKLFVEEFLLRIDRLIPTIGAIFAFIFGTLGIFKKIQSTVTLDLILFALGFILTALVIENFTSISKISQNLEIIRKSYPTANKFVTTKDKLPDIKFRIHGAKEIWVCGATLRGLIGHTSNFNLFKELLYSGTNLRFMIYKENSDIQNHILEFFPYDDETMNKMELFISDLKSSKIYLNRLLREQKNNSENVKGNIQIKLISTFLPHSLFIIDPGYKNSIIQVQLDVFRCKSSNYLPIFLFASNEDEGFYNLFEEEYKFLWEIADNFDGL